MAMFQSSIVRNQWFESGLTGCNGENFGQDGCVPSDHLALQLEADGFEWRWIFPGPTDTCVRGREDLGLADEVDDEGADDSHVPGAVSFAGAGLVFFEDDVEHPMKKVLDGLMPPDDLSRSDGGGR